MSMPCLAPQPIETSRLTLEPLNVRHADEMAPLLDDADLHQYIGGRPATLGELRERYERLSAGHSSDGQQGWLNWIARLKSSGAAVGLIEATLEGNAGKSFATLAWVIASPYQRQGYAKEAAGAVLVWLREHGVRSFAANVHPDHVASVAVAEHLGLTATAQTVDGENKWTRRGV
jgi:RimJ/RimL family protein N-acetyltransferase